MEKEGGHTGIFVRRFDSAQPQPYKGRKKPLANDGIAQQMTNSAQSEKVAPRTRGATPPASGVAPLLTPEEVAAFTALSLETLAQWRSQKRGIPYVKISRNCVRYRQTDLDVWVSERIVRTDQEMPEAGGRI